MKCLILLLLLCCGNDSGSCNTRRGCASGGQSRRYDGCRCDNNRYDNDRCDNNRYDNGRCDNDRCDNDRCEADRCDNTVRPEPRFEHRAFVTYTGSGCGCEEVRKNDDCGCNS